MKITYDPEVDVLYVQFKDTAPIKTRQLEHGITLEIDSEDALVGIEVLKARDRYGDKNVGTVLYENLALTMPGEE
jgi:uncharacterized protein YuzE